jgi:hypothetical protein
VRLDSYSIDVSPPRDEGFRLDAVSQTPTPTPTPIRITLRGIGFKVRAIDPKIMIGSVELKDYEIMSDESTIVGYLHEVPKEDAVISIGYGGGVRVELLERFSMNKLSSGDSPPDAR